MASADDALEFLIEEFHTEFERLRAVEAKSRSEPKPAPIDYDFGNLARNQNDFPPRTIWIEQGGSFDAGRIKGLEGETLATGVTRNQVGFWFPSKAECRKALFDMNIATHRTAYGPNVRWLSWEFPTEVEGRWYENGAALMIATVEVLLPVPKEVPGETVQVMPEGHEQKAQYDDPDGVTDPATAFSNWT